MEKTRISKYDKVFLACMAALFIFLISTFQYNSIVADEGTHLLLSVFYKDLATNIFQTGDFSFQHIYQYGINYLIHYPKLQIAYPPLYHLTNAAAFSVFGLSETIARTVNLIYAIGAFSLFYLIVKKYFSAKTALLSAVLFSFSPISLFFSSRALQDFSMFFFLLFSVFIFSSALQHLAKPSKRSVLLFSLVGFASFLAAMGKQMGGVVIFFFLAILAYNFLRQKKYRKQTLANSAVLLFAFLLPLIPYFFILNAVGGIEINKMVAIGYASEQGEPTSLADPMFWLWYPIKASVAAPFTPLFLMAFAFFVFRKQNHWKPLLLWFSIFFVLLTLIPNKEIRFFQIFFLPAYLAAGFYLEKILSSKKTHFWLLPLFFIAYFAASLLFFMPTVQYYPAKEIAQEVFSKLPENANIGVFADADPLFSSAIMWYIRVLDNKKIAIYRSCAFGNSSENALENIRKNNIGTIIYQTWDTRPDLKGLKPYLNLEKTITENNYTTEIYNVKNFTAHNQENICNYACLTGEKICTNN